MRLTARYWVLYLFLFSTICYYLLLFATVRRCSRLFAAIRTVRTIHYSLFGTIHCSLFAIRYSGFPDTPKILRNKHSVFVPNVAIFNPGKKFDRGRFWSRARQPLVSHECASRNQQKYAINCNFCQASSTWTLYYPRALFALYSSPG